MYLPRRAIQIQGGCPVPWTVLPAAWLEPAPGRRPRPWRPEWRLAPRPLTPYSAGWLERLLPGLTTRISRDLALPSGGVEISSREGYVYTRPRPVPGPGGWLPLRAALHGLRAGRAGCELLRWWDEQGVGAMLADISELRFRVAPLDSRPPEPRERVRVLERCLEVWSEHLDRVLRAEALAALARLQLQALLEAFGITAAAGQSPAAARAVHADDLIPVPSVEAEINQRLWHMAVRTRQEPAIREVFANGTDEPGRDERLDPGELHRRLSRVAARSGELGETGREFLALWNQFLERYGHLAWPVAELAAPSWAEDPSPALQILAAHFRDRGLSPIAEEINAGRRRQALLAGIEERLARRRIDRQRLEETRRLAEAMRRVSAEMGYHLLLTRSWWRRAVLFAGRDLAARGSLAGAGDVWFLTPDEVLSALTAAEAGRAPDLRAQATARRRAWERACHNAPPWAEESGAAEAR